MKLADIRDGRSIDRNGSLTDLAKTAVVQLDQYNLPHPSFSSCSIDIPQLLMIL